MTAANNNVHADLSQNQEGKAILSSTLKCRTIIRDTEDLWEIFPVEKALKPH